MYKYECHNMNDTNTSTETLLAHWHIKRNFKFKIFRHLTTGLLNLM